MIMKQWVLAFFLIFDCSIYVQADCDIPASTPQTYKYATKTLIEESEKIETEQKNKLESEADTAKYLFVAEKLIDIITPEENIAITVCLQNRDSDLIEDSCYKNMLEKLIKNDQFLKFSLALFHTDSCRGSVVNSAKPLSEKILDLLDERLVNQLSDYMNEYRDRVLEKFSKRPDTDLSPVCAALDLRIQLIVSNIELQKILDEDYSADTKIVLALTKTQSSICGVPK